MLHKIWEKCVNYETVSYLICGFLTTAVDFAVYTVLRHVDIGVGISQALSWMAAVLFAYVVNKLIVFRNYNMSSSYLVKEAGAFVAAIFRCGHMGPDGGHGEAGGRQGIHI